MRRAGSRSGHLGARCSWRETGSGARGRWPALLLVSSLALATLPVVLAVSLVASAPPAEAAATTTRVTVSATGGDMIAMSELRDATPDGRYVLFRGNGGTNGYCTCPSGAYELYRRDRQAGVSVHVSATAAGQKGNQGINYGGAISDDGRYAAFSSTSTDLVPGDTNAKEDVFVKDLATGAVARASVGPGGAQGDNVSDDPAISGDGRHVAFRSAATNLVAADTNAYPDIFVFDRVSATTERVSLTSAGAQGSSYAYNPSLSADGRYVVFGSHDVIIRAHCVYVLGHLWSDGALERVVSPSAIAALRERLARLAVEEGEELGDDLASFKEFWDEQ